MCVNNNVITLGERQESRLLCEQHAPVDVRVNGGISIDGLQIAWIDTCFQYFTLLIAKPSLINGYKC